MAVATTLGLPSIPADVSAFVARNELASGIQPVLIMSQEVLRGCSMALRVEQDAEIESEQHIVIEVDVTTWSVDDMFSAWNRWTEEFCRICPAEMRSPSKSGWYTAHDGPRRSGGGQPACRGEHRSGMEFRHQPRVLCRVPRRARTAGESAVYRASCRSGACISLPTIGKFRTLKNTTERRESQRPSRCSQSG